jgi:hypothetical protein
MSKTLSAHRMKTGIHTKNLKVTVQNLPLSVANSEVEFLLKRLGVKLLALFNLIVSMMKQAD